MGKNTNLSRKFNSNLEKWAEESLQGIGIFKDKVSDVDFKRLKKTVIDQLREVYSDKAIDLFLMPLDKRKLDSPDAYGSVNGSCGDSMEIYLKIDDGMITDSCFQTDGCKNTIASGGMVAEMVKGKKIEEIKKLTPQDVLDSLGGLPKENEHCASLAIHTLKEALEDLKERKNK